MSENISDIDLVLDYHQKTKHHVNRPARSLGYMDWKNQPNPFRHYLGTSSVALEHSENQAGPLYHDLFSQNIPPQKVDYSSISQLFYYSMALSAWKQVPGGASWPLRVNPSSGNLHPTESYLLVGSQALPQIESALYHYRPDCHVLERRRTVDPLDWGMFADSLPTNGFFVGLSSIYWRETWKYGERGFRYCHHDVGHAIGAISIAALAMGWNATLVDGLPDDLLSKLLGCEHTTEIEAEHVDCLIAVAPKIKNRQNIPSLLSLNQTHLKTLKASSYIGEKNRLSEHHHDWPLINVVSAASRKKTDTTSWKTQEAISYRKKIGTRFNSDQTAFQIIRKRRSAVAMDGLSKLDQGHFFSMLQHLQVGDSDRVFSTLPWTSQISIVLFVHRIDGLEPGLYVLVRNPTHLDLLKMAIRSDFLWRKPAVCPASLDFYLLASQDVRRISKTVSCTQDIAGDGTFSLGMLAHFESVIRENGAHFYPRLFWEAGLIGQLLYLDAEAVGLQGTGIGCFFDDDMHDLLGLRDLSWQSLYHFTVGGSKEDERLQTRPAYHHLQKEFRK